MIALLVPSRRRPGNIARFVEALLDTDSDVTLFVGLDDDDEQNYPYLRAWCSCRVQQYALPYKRHSPRSPIRPTTK
jgi:hypothetical protein